MFKNIKKFLKKILKESVLTFRRKSKETSIEEARRGMKMNVFISLRLQVFNILLLGTRSPFRELDLKIIILSGTKIFIVFSPH